MESSAVMKFIKSIEQSRTIAKMGSGFVIYLPKNYVAFKGLKKGDAVCITVKKKGE